MSRGIQSKEGLCQGNVISQIQRGTQEVSRWGKGQPSGRAGAELRNAWGQARERSRPTAGGHGEPGGGFMLNAALCKKGSQQILIQQGQKAACGREFKCRRSQHQRVPLAVCLHQHSRCSSSKHSPPPLQPFPPGSLPPRAVGRAPHPPPLQVWLSLSLLLGTCGSHLHGAGL